MKTYRRYSQRSGEYKMVKTKKESEEYTVVFVPKLKDVKKLEGLFKALSKKDKTFSYSRRDNFFSFDDSDKKRIFGRAMWLKEKLAEKGVDLFFSMFGHKKESSTSSEEAFAKYIADKRC